MLALGTPTKPPAAPTDAPQAGSSLLGAMVIVARHRGIHLSQAQLRRDHRLGPGEIASDQLLQIARASGMRAVATELNFRKLMQLGTALPAILVLALIWSLLHVQYDWFGTAQVFLIGVLFGFVRWRSGSTTLVILLHMLLNLESVVETVIVMGWV